MQNSLFFHNFVKILLSTEQKAAYLLLNDQPGTNMQKLRQNQMLKYGI